MGRAGLQCANCHRPTEDGVRFQPVNMERDCEGCHSLAYDHRRRHRAAVASRRRRPDDRRPDRCRPGYNPAAGRAAPAAGRIRGWWQLSHQFQRRRAIPAALSSRRCRSDGVCGECHTPTMRGGRPGVVPVTPRPRATWRTAGSTIRRTPRRNAPRATPPRLPRPPAICCCPGWRSAGRAIWARTIARRKCLRVVLCATTITPRRAHRAV